MEIPSHATGSIALLLLLLAACYLAGAGLFAQRGERNSIGLAVVWFAGGLCLIAFSFLLSKLTGSRLVFFALLPALIAALNFYRRPGLRVTMEARPGEQLSALALSSAYALPVIVMGIRMGAGEYPAEFFAADSPYFLQQVYALMRTDSYPPPSLETYGFAFKYHYGVQAFAALASTLTGLKPHFVMFAVLEPLLQILAGYLAYDICRRLTGRRGTALLGLALVLLGSKQYFINYLDPSWWRFVIREENFDFRYPNAPDVAGLLISLCAVRCVLEFERRNLRLAALFFMCMLPVFKIPFLIPVSAGLALVYGHELRKRFRVGLLVEIAGAALVASAVYLVFAQSPVTTDRVAELAFPGFAAMSFPWQDQTILILASVAVVTALVTWRRIEGGLSKLLLFALAPYALFSFWRVEIDNTYQIFNLATRLAALFTAAYFASAWFAGPRRIAGQHLLGAAIVIVLTGPGVISFVHHVYIVTKHPERGHEYADNRAVADALKHIPVDNTLIVTNDLRYPADRYLRDNRQFQLAGIFGHRNFASNLEYGGFRRNGMIQYLGLMQLFRMSGWPAAQIEGLREKFGITHVLIHKNYAHADRIPLELVYENDAYQVYRF